MQPNIKICGIKTKEDLAAISKLEPNYLGFYFL